MEDFRFLFYFFPSYISSSYMEDFLEREGCKESVLLLGFPIQFRFVIPILCLLIGWKFRWV